MGYLNVHVQRGYIEVDENSVLPTQVLGKTKTALKHKLCQLKKANNPKNDSERKNQINNKGIKFRLLSNFSIVFWMQEGNGDIFV